MGASQVGADRNEDKGYDQWGVVWGSRDTGTGGSRGMNDMGVNKYAIGGSGYISHE